MTGAKWQRDSNWIGSEIDDAFVMVNIDTGKYVALNVTANAVWRAMEEPVSQDAIEQALRAEYDVPEAECSAAVSALLTQMQDLQLAAPV
jgi:hypothetical protein